MLKRMLTIGAITVGLFLVTAGVASVHWVYWGQLTWVDLDIGCSYVQSKINHGTSNGQSSEGLTRAKAHTGSECGAHWGRPIDHLRVKWQLFRKDPDDYAWELCRSIPTQYNPTASWFVRYKSFHGNNTPCDEGDYNLRTWGSLKYGGSWYGHLLVHSYNHYFD